MDRDNLLKPVQDALTGIAYVDDRQVIDAMCNWRDINGRFRVRYVPLALATAFVHGSDFLHVRLWTTTADEDLG